MLRVVPVLDCTQLSSTVLGRRAQCKNPAVVWLKQEPFISSSSGARAGWICSYVSLTFSCIQNPLKRTVVNKAGLTLEEAFWSQIQGAQIYFYLSFKHWLPGSRSVFKHFSSSVLRFLMERENYEGHVLIFHWPWIKTGWLANILCLPTCAELPLSSIKDPIPIRFSWWMGEGEHVVCAVLE